MFVQRNGNAQLRADAVHAADQHGPPVFLGVQREQPPEPANCAEHFRPKRLADFGFESALQRVGERNVNAGGSVSALGKLSTLHTPQCARTSRELQGGAAVKMEDCRAGGRLEPSSG